MRPKFIVTSANRRAKTKMVSMGQSRGSGIFMCLCKGQSEEPVSDKVQVGARYRDHWKLGEVIYWKLKDINHETNNKNNRKIARRGESPNRGIMEHKNMHNGG